jgi:hypothetical protein
MVAVNQVQVAPLLGREMAKERRIVEWPLMRLESVEQLLEVGDGGGLIAPRRRERLLGREHARFHLLLSENSFQHYPAEQHPDDPWNLEGLPVERTLNEVREVCTDLGQVPLAELVEPAPVQAVKLITNGPEVLELKFTLGHW